ncbi:hypothetical protein NECAME_15890 [Necator americanus]|uniref:Uncharacterized protein n=1 Tax=Necator americanus TaxID=51031 RepID=W2SFN7_NECAM|nr:hypothetical protein NECAME_15890 [Necator americanus]ETN68328.1 hypothetical protein NECAME_15890 [Necator americanus]
MNCSVVMLQNVRRPSSTSQKGQKAHLGTPGYPFGKTKMQASTFRCLLQKPAHQCTASEVPSPRKPWALHADLSNNVDIHPDHLD